MLPPTPWRSFKFFESHEDSLGLVGVEITCADFSALAIAAGDAGGRLHLWDRGAGGLHARRSFPAFTGALTHLAHLPARQILVGVGDDNALDVSILRLFLLGEGESEGEGEGGVWRPPFREYRLFSARPPGSAVRQLCVADDLRLAVVALADGGLVVLRGDLARGRGVARAHLRGSLSAAGLSLVGLPPPALVRIPERAAGALEESAARVLYAVHEDRLTAWRVSPAGFREFACPAVDFGAAVGKAALGEGGLLALCDGVDRVVVLGMGAGRGPFDPTSPNAPLLRITLDNKMPKRRMLWHKDYLVGLARDEVRPGRFHLQCYDLQNHLRVLSRSQELYQDVRFVLSSGTDLIVVMRDPQSEHDMAYKVTRLSEVDTQTKLEALFSKECYDIAQNISSRLKNVDPALQVDVQRRYADYLYRKGRYSEAVDRYIECIGHLEPSYVIRRYRQPPQLPLLAKYLEALHCTAHGYRASVTYTTLLLKVYIRMRKEDSLLAFLHREDVRFDAKEVIAVCRAAGYHKAALYLADKYVCIGEHASILFYDLHQHRQALEFIETLGVEEAEGVLARMGKDLLRILPLRTTELLIQLSIGWKGPPRRISFGQTPAGSTSFVICLPARRAVVERLRHIFIGMPACLLHYLRALVGSGVLEEKGESSNTKNTNNPKSSRSLYNTLFELYITEEFTQKSPPSPHQKDEKRVKNDEEPEVETFPVEPLPQRQEQALLFLTSYAGRYDEDLALSLSYLHHFREGIIFLHRRMNLRREALRFRAGALVSLAKKAPFDEREAAQRELLEAAREAITSSSSSEVKEALWKSLLLHLAQNYSSEEEKGGRENSKRTIIAEVLDEVDASEALAPALVVELLSKPTATPPTTTTTTNNNNDEDDDGGRNSPTTMDNNRTLPLGVVRGYLEKVLTKRAERSARLQSEARLYRTQLDGLRRRLLAFQSAAVVFPPSSSSFPPSLSSSSADFYFHSPGSSLPCARCGGPLDLPALRFRCGHGVHAGCCEDASGGCGVCGLERGGDPNAGEEGLSRNTPAGEFFRTLQFETCREGEEKKDSAASCSSLPPSGGVGVVADYIRAGALHPSYLVRSGSLLSLGADLIEEDHAAIEGGGRGSGGGEKELYDRNGDVVNPGVVESW